MALVVNTNTASLGAQRNLQRTGHALDKNIRRLSSGLRIANASDDAAGLGISERLKAQIRGLSQASRNASDGISMAQIAEGAMNEQADILTRLRELSVQSANGTLGDNERGFINTEATQLIQELDRITSVTEYNGVNMLASGSSVDVQVGINSGETINIAFGQTDSATLGTSAGGAALSTIDLSSQGGADTALDIIDQSIDDLSSARASVGASQNRLETTLNVLSSAHENLSAANSRIRDVDVAEETASLTRNQILSQAGVAVLAQANQLPSAALSLLQ